MKVYRLDEASEKKIKYINRHPNLSDEQKEKIIDLYIRPEIPDNIVDWNIFNSYSFEELKSIAENYLKEREEKKSKKNLSRALEGRDYIKVFENTSSRGTEYLYLPLTWLGSKYLASDHFLPKIKVPSKQMDARDFSDTNAKNEDLSPGAKWCISLWTIPDLVIDDKPVTDENGKELRHEGKRYWLNYTSEGYYFLFYFRDSKRVKDINKKIALTLSQGSSKIENITLADDTVGRRSSVIEGIQEYWDEHYYDYKFQIYNIREVSKEDYPKFREYEKQKEQEARNFYNSQMREPILKEYFTYNKSTGRYDSKWDINEKIIEYLIDNSGFTVPLGIINGNFNCGNLGLKTLKNGPTEVRGKFDCSWNNLTSLEYAPKEVEGLFDCYHNNLTTLKGAPKTVGGTLDCGNNKLTTLEGAPSYVGGSFSCWSNKLTTLKGAPEKVGGNFNCSENHLTSLEYAPQTIGHHFDCSLNQLKTLKGAPNEVRGDFKCQYNLLTSLEYVPQTIGKNFYCHNNKLTNLKGAPEYVGGNFYCWYNPLQSKELSTNVKGRVLYY